ncbi:hypothetical protein QVK63_002406 [Vibrio vulnificus]|uniref:hypothetical protein n=1 Tax=Vibrio vulnificus TaxID=672 RepID=UPI001A27DBA2|nr:hypothetical protein [Vibrio vulnificus]ELO5515114.1 hypothetical protein [Vibrio vulnificus]HAS8248067.1 hypothetical protein [Vibrio vulnificus]
MSDWEDVFGGGTIYWVPQDEPCTRVRVRSQKELCYEKKKAEFHSVTRRLGFKWCLRHGVIAFPRLSDKAIFIDRRDSASYQSHVLSRLIIEPLDKVVRLTLITRWEEVKVEYKISDKYAYYNAILIALDFKFSTTIPFINIESMQKDEIYQPLKN